MKIRKSDTRKLFWSKGPCSTALFYILNREYGYPKPAEEYAADPFSGGIMQRGYQCGMLWGASLAVGAEARRRYQDHGQAVAAAITATQHLMESFYIRKKTVNCRDITLFDTTTKWGMAKFFLTGKPIGCMNFAATWAPEALDAAGKGFSSVPKDIPDIPLSCASEVAKKMGASDEEMVIVAGFAGGLGLSGNACGALSAAIWMKTLAYCKKHPANPPYPNTEAIKIQEAFQEFTGNEFQCNKICGQRFNSIGEHTEFIKSGGCKNLIDLLART
ncbi:MAG: C-GCAxxG-C-C family (seleno)protein [Bacteroidales bacterium]